MKRVFESCVKSKTWPLYLWGDAGRGKTSAMGCVYRCCPASVSWLRMSEFVATIQACRRNGQIVLPGSMREVGEATIWRTRVDDPGLLCVDDCGVVNPSESAFGIIYELVDRRATKPVIYTSNLSPRKLQSVYDGRIFSRMQRGLSVEVTGDDQRLVNAKSVRL